MAVAGSTAPSQDTAQALGVFGASLVMQAVLQRVREAASNGRSVLICGEAGTGRGRIARSIHALAGCAPETFVHLDCSLLDADDCEERLFGSTLPSRSISRPAGTECLSSNSLIWRARNGTLYLANIVETPSPIQVRLGRLIRDRNAIGPDGCEVRITSRLIASVEPGFDAALAEGRLRRDFYSRFSGFRIEVPPLRDRKEDIPHLARFFLQEYARSVGKTPKDITAAAAMLLQALPWQGNAWELRGLIESLAQWVPGDSIDLHDVLASVRLDPQARSVAVGGTLRAARRRFEREYVHAVLQQFSGRVTAAARALGIQRSNLYRKMRSLGILVPGNPFNRPVRRR